jgi:hypothetical protein
MEESTISALIELRAMEYLTGGGGGLDVATVLGIVAVLGVVIGVVLFVVKGMIDQSNRQQDVNARFQHHETEHAARTSTGI